MQADFAKNRLELLHVMEMRIISTSGNDITVEILDTGTNFLDGNINWTEDVTLVPTLLGQDRGVPFRSDGERWNLRLHEGEITQSYTDALLKD